MTNILYFAAVSLTANALVFLLGFLCGSGRGRRRAVALSSPTDDAALALVDGVETAVADQSGFLAAFFEMIRQMNPGELADPMHASARVLLASQRSFAGRIREWQHEIARLSQPQRESLRDLQQSLHSYRAAIEDACEGLRSQDIQAQDVSAAAAPAIDLALSELLQLSVQMEQQLRCARARIESLEAKLREAEVASRTDPLTRLPNRRAFDQTMDALEEDTTGQPHCLLVLDVNCFKAVNDQYGHAAGDAMLAVVGKLLHEACSPRFDCFRYAGDEFVILAPRTDREHGAALAGRISRTMSRATIRRGQDTIPVSVSIGVAVRQSGQGVAQWFRDADAAMYAAKRSGEGVCVQPGSHAAEMSDVARHTRLCGRPHDSLADAQIASGWVG